MEQNSRTRKNSTAESTRYKADTCNKQNFKSTKLDSRVLKQQLNMINIERKSLTRQSISEVTKELDQTRSRKRLTKAINETRNRESFPIAIRKEAILENLVSKLDAEEELRHILERRYRNSISSSSAGFGGITSKNSLVSSVALRPQELGSSGDVNQYLVEKVRAYENQIEQLKQLLFQSNQKVKRLEQQNHHHTEAKRRTKEKSIQTQGQEPANSDFLVNLQKTIQVLNSSGKYALY